MNQPLAKIVTVGDEVMLKTAWTSDELGSRTTEFGLPPEGGIVLRRGESLCFEHRTEGLVVYRGEAGDGGMR